MSIPTEKQERSFDVISSMPADLRGCVYEFGFPIVNAFLSAGVSKPSVIRQLVHEIWQGPRGAGQKGGLNSELDWLLTREQPICSATLKRVLVHNSHVIVPLDGSREMIDASMATVSGFNERMTKTEKHRRRLVAALRAEAAKAFA